MTGTTSLDFAILAVSLGNAVIACWLGLTLLLTAERRSWGLWLVAAGLLLGGAFFLCHTAILGRSLVGVLRQAATLWGIGWASLAATPLAWYVAMLWYAGAFEPPGAALLRRHRYWLVLAGAMFLGGLALLALRGLPLLDEVGGWGTGSGAGEGVAAEMPATILAYSVYILGCVTLSLDALRRPAPSGRVMGDLARRRARPWLVASSLALLAVSALVAWTLLWVFRTAAGRGLLGLSGPDVIELGWLDLAIECGIGASLVFLGQAIVSYEIFSGETLPRGGLKRLWRWALLLAAGHGIAFAWILTREVPATTVAVVATPALTGLFGLLAWRTLADRKRLVADLRTFLSGPRLCDSMLMKESSAGESNESRPFHVLCTDVLGAERAWLVAVGPMAPLFGKPLAFPAGIPPPDGFDLLAERVASSPGLCVALGDGLAGTEWGVPLPGLKGPVGALLLGPRAGGGLYTQEEMETARLASVRVIDLRAGAELARRLVAIQRDRMAESLVVDRRARTTLHDEILPRLHAAMLAAGPGPQTLAQLADVHRRLSDLLREMPGGSAPDTGRQGLLGALRQTVDDEFRSAFDGVDWALEEGVEAACANLPPLMAEVLFGAAREAVRNAAKHGRGRGGNRPLHLRIEGAVRDGLALAILDDGVGLLAGAGGGTGQGLTLHGTLVAIVGGSLTVEPAGPGTRVVLRVS